MPQYNETRSGVCLTVDGIDFTPEELVAMVLTHAKDITKAYGGEQGKDPSTLGSIQDCVLTVPSFATQHERRALLDAAALADLNVLALIDETTAAALHYGMDKSFEENEQILIFYNLGASALQVSIVRFFSYPHKETKFSKEKMVTGIEVLGKAWDSTLGGNALDHVIMEYLADEFNSHYKGSKGDIRTNARSMTKLRLQANKVKHVLSANTEIPIYIDALFDDTPLDTHLTRAHLENLAHDILARAVTPIDAALQAANVTLEQVHGIELIGGGMRVPKIQEALQAYLGEHITELGMHINSDESMALGAAFHGANISTAFKVRHVGLTDVNPFGIQVSLEEYGGDANSKKKNDDEEPWSKQAVMFKSFGKVGVKKTIAFTHDKDVHCAIDYVQDGLLPTGTSTAIERYNITGVKEFAEEMEAKGLGKPKISLQFELSTSGIVKLVKAEAAVEEIVIVQEEVEVDDDEEGKNATVEEDDAKQIKEDKADGEGDQKESSEDKDTEANETEKEAAASETETEAVSNETDANETSKETLKKERKTKMVDKVSTVAPF
jgi:hypoxia up-regulated 1